VPSVLRSEGSEDLTVEGSADVEDDASALGLGVPEMGEPDVPRAAGDAVGWFMGSAECWRFS
jgi:hypothetical protein